MIDNDITRFYFAVLSVALKMNLNTVYIWVQCTPPNVFFFLQIIETFTTSFKSINGKNYIIDFSEQIGLSLLFCQIIYIIMPL